MGSRLTRPIFQGETIMSENTAPNTEETPKEASAEDEEEHSDPRLVKVKEISAEEFTLKAKRKYHPNEKNYIGCDSFQETMVAEIMFMGQLNAEQTKLYSKGKLIFSPETTEKFWGEILPNDLLGYKGNVYKVVRKTKSGLILNRRKPKYYRNDEDVYETAEFKVSKPDIDFALNTKFTEILYRDGKVYGMSEDMEVKVKIKLSEDKDGNLYTSTKSKEISASRAIPATTGE